MIEPPSPAQIPNSRTSRWRANTRRYSVRITLEHTSDRPIRFSISISFAAFSSATDMVSATSASMRPLDLALSNSRPRHRYVGRRTFAGRVRTVAQLPLDGQTIDNVDLRGHVFIALPVRLQPRNPAHCLTRRGISSAPKIFLQKRLSHKGCPFLGQKPFLDRFLGEGA
jgi:hypothetical protein